jgi:hypothetical protein
MAILPEFSFEISVRNREKYGGNDPSKTIKNKCSFGLKFSFTNLINGGINFSGTITCKNLIKLNLNNKRIISSTVSINLQVEILQVQVSLRLIFE